MAKAIDVQKFNEKYQTFVKEKETVILSFIDGDGKPFSSCAPFVEKNNKLYVYISEVAEHYRLMETNDYVDALLIGDEAKANNKFATERARWICRTKNIGNDGHEDIFALFNEAHGEKLMNVLRGLDFSLFELSPEQGRYVVGFGLAFNCTIDGSVFEHVVIDKEKEETK